MTKKLKYVLPIILLIYPCPTLESGIRGESKRFWKVEYPSPIKEKRFWKMYELESLIKRIIRVQVKVTKYNSVVEQTDDTPDITSSNKKIYKGVVALSKDLEEQFGFKFGDKVYLKGLGVFIFEDRMNKKWSKRVDIYEESIEEAKKFGVVKTELILK